MLSAQPIVSHARSVSAPCRAHRRRWPAIASRAPPETPIAESFIKGYSTSTSKSVGSLATLASLKGAGDRELATLAPNGGAIP